MMGRTSEFVTYQHHSLDSFTTYQLAAGGPVRLAVLPETVLPETVLLETVLGTGATGGTGGTLRDAEFSRFMV